MSAEEVILQAFAFQAPKRPLRGVSMVQTASGSLVLQNAATGLSLETPRDGAIAGMRAQAGC